MLYLNLYFPFRLHFQNISLLLSLFYFGFNPIFFFHPLHFLLKPPLFLFFFYCFLFPH